MSEENGQPGERTPKPDAGQAEGVSVQSTTVREDQRSRVLHAIVQVVGEHGYLRAKIGEISSRAGVSRATFYEMFESKQHCFLAAYGELAEAAVERVRMAIDSLGSDSPVEAALAVLVDHAERERSAFDCLMHEVTLAGPRGIAERDRLMGRLVEVIEEAQVASSDPPAYVSDIPLRMLLGGAVRALGMRMRRGDQDLGRLLGELVAWSDLYRVSRKAARWAEMEPNRVLLDRASHEVTFGMFTPQGPPRGRHRLPPSTVRRLQRERILHATASAMSQKGYAETTVADIVAAAGLSREVFYAHVGGRREALVEASKLFFEQSIAAMAGAFFTAPDSWPERVWAAGAALSEFLVAAPAFTRLAFIEAYAPDLAAARRTDELFLGFTMFLEGGQRERPHGKPIPTFPPEALTGAMIEAVAIFISEDRIMELPGLLPLATYMTLAPFTGFRFANEFVDHKLRELTSEHA